MGYGHLSDLTSRINTIREMHNQRKARQNKILEANQHLHHVESKAQKKHDE